MISKNLLRRRYLVFIGSNLLGHIVACLIFLVSSSLLSSSSGRIWFCFGFSDEFLISDMG